MTMPKGRLVLMGALGVVAALETVGIVTDSDTISAIVADTFHVGTMSHCARCDGDVDRRLT